MRSLWTVGILVVATAVLVGCKSEREEKRPGPFRAMETMPAPDKTPPSPKAPKVDPALRPGPQHARREQAAKKLESCLLAAGAIADGCLAAEVTAEHIDAVPAAQFSGAAAVEAWRRNTWGLGLGDARTSVWLTLLKGYEAVFLVHVQGKHTQDLAGIAPTGAEVAVSGALHVRYNRQVEITEIELLLDQTSVLGQIGGTSFTHRPAMPAPSGEPRRALASGLGSEAKGMQVLKMFPGDLNEHSGRLMLEYYTQEPSLDVLWRPEAVQGRAAIRAAYEREFVGSRDSNYRMKWAWPAQDHVLLWLQRQGSNTGPELGAKEASKGAYTTQELHVFRLERGKISKHWMFGNSLSMTTQAGIASPARP